MMKKVLALIIVSLILTTFCFSTVFAQTAGNVKVLVDFESDEIIPVVEYNPDNLEMGISTSEKFSGKRSYEVVTKPEGGDPSASVIFNFTDNAYAKDWSRAEYLQVWLKNVGEQPIHLKWFQFFEGENAEFYEAWVLKGNVKAQLMQDGKFVETDVIDVGGDTGIILIPAGYEGFLRIKLDTQHLKYGWDSGNGAKDDIINTAKMWRVNFYVDHRNCPNNKLYIDDLSIVGRKVEGISEADYFAVKDSKAAEVKTTKDTSSENVKTESASTSTKASNPKTGDASAVSMIVVSILSGTGALMLAKIKREKE